MPAKIEEPRDRFLANVAAGPVVMGILNVTPDSFSDGGQFVGADAAIAQAQRMAEAGAAIVDLGGESTRPGAVPVAEDEEWSRIAPVLSTLKDALSVPISIDTYKAPIARRAVLAGAAVINDVWGLQGDPAMADTVAETGAAVVAMHNRREVAPEMNILDDVAEFFETTLSLAHAAGIPADHIILDPGLGFGKTPEQNFACLKHLDHFQRFGKPLLLGLSRKSMIGHALDADVGDRLIGTLAANVIGLANGARILRVHDVAEHKAAIDIYRATEAAK